MPVYAHISATHALLARVPDPCNNFPALHLRHPQQADSDHKEYTNTPHTTRPSQDTMAPPTKKRKITVTAPEKIEFDPSAREEYLTGFHKRKVARQKFAQEEIAKREKEEKLQFRKEVRHSISVVSALS
jgi:hypothetical protein